jgi:acylpyruvate hydrolase
VDLNLLCAGYLAKVQNEVRPYDLADLWIPPDVSLLLERGEPCQAMLSEILQYVEQSTAEPPSGPSRERLFYSLEDVRLLRPVHSPPKMLVVGFSDQTKDVQKKRTVGMPTAFYKLPTTLAGPGDPIPYPKFTQELDCDVCLGIVIGRAGRRIAREQALNHIGGFTLLLDVTARDVCREESKTNNNLLSKNIRGSSPLGPALVLNKLDAALQSCPVELSVDGILRQKFTLQELIFSVEDVIAHWSTVGLSVGDVLALGANLALKSDSPILPAILKPGMTVTCFCPAVGEMSSTVVLDFD